LLDSNSDSSISFSEYAAYMTAERDWDSATAESNELTYDAAVAIGKSDLEWEWLDSNDDSVVTLTEW